MFVLAPGWGPRECGASSGDRLGFRTARTIAQEGMLYPQTKNETIGMLASPGGFPGTRVTSLGWSFADEYWPRHHARRFPLTGLPRTSGAAGDTAGPAHCGIHLAEHVDRH